MKLKKLLKHFQDNRGKVTIHLHSNDADFEYCYTDIQGINSVKKYWNYKVISWEIGSDLVYNTMERHYYLKEEVSIVITSKRGDKDNESDITNA